VIPGRDNEGQRFQLVVGCIQRVGFQEQKHLGGSQYRSLVAVLEGMIAADV
jgi:hypothetical protein